MLGACLGNWFETYLLADKHKTYCWTQFSHECSSFQRKVYFNKYFILEDHKMDWFSRQTLQDKQNYFGYMDSALGRSTESGWPRWRKFSSWFWALEGTFPQLAASKWGTVLDIKESHVLRFHSIPLYQWIVQNWALNHSALLQKSRKVCLNSMTSATPPWVQGRWKNMNIQSKHFSGCGTSIPFRQKILLKQLWVPFKGKNKDKSPTSSQTKSRSIFETQTLSKDDKMNGLWCGGLGFPKKL